MIHPESKVVIVPELPRNHFVIAVFEAEKR
jgi:hypothetical protein